MIMEPGAQLHDKDGNLWLYIGYKQPKKGNRQLNFQMTLPWPKGVDPYNAQYRAVKWSTIQNKFPDLRQYEPPEGVENA